MSHTGRKEKSASFNHVTENEGLIGVEVSHGPRNRKLAPVTNAMIVGITHSSLVFWFMTEFDYDYSRSPPAAS